MYLQPNIKLAAVDCTKEKEAARQVTITGYPTGRVLINMKTLIII